MEYTMPLVSSSLATPQPIYIGVDPGMSGGLAIITPDESMGMEMPESERDIWDWFHLWEDRRFYAAFAVIEIVHAMPGNGVSGMFKFGMSYGGLRMALTAAAIPFDGVRPQEWQKALGIKGRDKKDGESQPDFKKRLRARAQQLFPSLEVTLATADALLLAEYCRRTQIGGHQ